MHKFKSDSGPVGCCGALIVILEVDAAVLALFPRGVRWRLGAPFLLPSCRSVERVPKAAARERVNLQQMRHDLCLKSLDHRFSPGR